MASASGHDNLQSDADAPDEIITGRSGRVYSGRALGCLEPSEREAVDDEPPCTWRWYFARKALREKQAAAMEASERLEAARGAL